MDRLSWVNSPVALGAKQLTVRMVRASAFEISMLLAMVEERVCV